IFVHGGGWRAGSRQEMHKIMEGFCDHGFICASFDYRLAGVNAFNQLTDLRHAYDYFISFLKERKLPLKTVTFGSSAGAHLSALLALAAPGECGEELEFNGRSPQNEWVRPLGSVFQAVPMFFEPWEDIFPQIWNSMQGIAGVSWREHPEVYKRLAPMEYINAGTQPLFFMNASDEHMFPHRYTLEAAEKLRSFGAACLIKNYENAEHGFFYDLTRRQQKQAFSDMLEFIANFTD
ncbi:MAG: alpha/beta hydrolase fold domain-containing protein, partial [Victivallales bacterium]